MGDLNCRAARTAGPTVSQAFPEDVETSLLGRTLGQTFLSLRNRNFKLFFIGQTISNTGNWLTNVAQVLLVMHLTNNSGVAVGLLAACQFGPMLFLSAWAGAIADRSDKRHMLMWTQSLEMAESVCLAILAFMPHPPLIGLYVLGFFGGVLLAFDNPLRRSFVSEMVPPEDIPNAVVLYSLIVNVSRIFGPALAGLLVVTLGFGWCFTIDAATYLAVLLCIFLMRPAELYRTAPKPRVNGEIRDGLRYVLDMPVLWVSFTMLAVIGLLGYNFNVTLPLYVTLGLHSQPTFYSFLYAVFSLGAVISALVIANKALVEMRHIILGAASLGLATLLLGFAPNAVFAVPAVFLVGVTSILYMTSTTAIIQVEGKPEMHGRVIALQTMVVGGGLFVGGPIAGWFADMLGGRAPIILGGVACLLAATWGYFASRRYAHLTSAQVAPADN
ncbi:MAG: MFS transporter [Coriobacteriia bacterium]|nr:MFS transporter [Coriobacteriia bacterium]